MSTRKDQSENSLGRQKSAKEMFGVERRPGDMFFALLLTLSALLLLSQLGTQTKWVSGVGFFSQPRFWPGLCLVGYLIFSLGHLIHSYLDHRKRGDGELFPVDELIDWCRPAEFVAYFMLYVFIVPLSGYLPATLLACVLLTLRAGYRSGRFIMVALAFGFSTVLIFKTFLHVRIPGGMLYSQFPDQIRNFLVLNF